MTSPVTDGVEAAIQAQLFPPGPEPADAITVYDGADPAKGQKFAFRAWDLRGPLLKLAWDLLRFQLIDNGKLPPDRKTPLGLRDSVNIILRTTDQNNAILQRLAASAKVDISDITGIVVTPPVVTPPAPCASNHK